MSRTEPNSSPTNSEGRPIVQLSVITKAVDDGIAAESQAQAIRDSNAMLARAAGSTELVLMVEKQANRANLTLHGAYTIKAIEKLLDELLLAEGIQIEIQAPFLAGAFGLGFGPTANPEKIS